jgi:hypothetical protein
MKEFLMIFRNVPPSGDAVPSPEQLKDISKPWQDWMGGIAAQGKLANPGNRLGFAGATLKADTVTDGPYAEIKEIILGYTALKTETLAEAIELAKGCPILTVGGNVEVREIVPMNG